MALDQVSGVLKGQQGPVATYAYNDIASGTGIVNFYVGKANTNYILSSFQFYSEPIYTSEALTSVPDTKEMDIDFDALINKQITVRGNSVVNVPVRLTVAAAGTGYVYAIAKLRKWNGAAETEIASGTSATKSTGVGTIYNMLSCFWSVPSTTIKRGEYLRVTIEVYAWLVSGGTGTVYVGHDPFGTLAAPWDSTLVSTKATVPIPMRIYE